MEELGYKAMVWPRWWPLEARTEALWVAASVVAWN